MNHGSLKSGASIFNTKNDEPIIPIAITTVPTIVHTQSDLLIFLNPSFLKRTEKETLFSFFISLKVRNIAAVNISPNQKNTAVKYQENAGSHPS
jgi:hypothetical protein